MLACAGEELTAGLSAIQSAYLFAALTLAGVLVARGRFGQLALFAPVAAAVGGLVFLA